MGPPIGRFDHDLEIPLCFQHMNLNGSFGASFEPHIHAGLPDSKPMDFEDVDRIRQHWSDNAQATGKGFR